MGACTATISKVFVEGDRKRVIATVAPSASYSTGGDTLPGSTLGLELELNDVQVPAANTGATRLYSFDRTNSKLLIYTALSTEAAGASNQSANTIVVEATGKGSASS